MRRMRKDAGRKNPRRIHVPEQPRRPYGTHHTPQSLAASPSCNRINRLLSASYVPPQEIREQRSIIRERARLTQLRTIIKNRIHTLLDKHSIKTPYTDISGKHSLEWLSKLELPPSDRILLDVNLEQLNSLNHSIDKLTEAIAATAITNPEVKLLMGFTGIDYYSAMLLINEIGPIARFSSSKKLVSYAGLAPGTRQSGNHTTHGHITKEGNSHIRWILVEAA